MSSSQSPSGSFELRDDNLRLLFSEAAKRDLAERLRAIELGFIVLSVCALMSVTAWIFRLLGTTPQSGISLFELLLRFDGIQNFMISIALLAAGILVVLSPVIFTMLMIERRRCRREAKDLEALLRRYGRH